MGLLNFLGGAAGAGADILQRERESAVRLQERNAGADYDAKLREKQVRTEAELRKQYEREKIAYENSPEYLAMLARTDEAKATNALTTRSKLAPKAGEVAKTEFEAGAPTRKAEQAEKQEFMLAEFRAKSAEELRADIARGNNKEYLRSVSNEAAAKRDPNAAAASSMDLKLKQLALREKEAEAKIPPAVKGSIVAIQKQADAISAALTKAELEGATTDSAAVKKYQDRLADLNGQISKLYEPYLPEGSKPAKTDKPAAGGEQQAHADAMRAIATGRITEAEVNKRLERAGFGPITGGATKPQAVAGRPFYDAPRNELQRMASKPRGVSTDEANAARAELESRKGDQRMTGG